MTISPMMQHYLQVKEKYKDCIIFYRLGDFYEMFFDDAVECSKVLDLTLTGKDCGLEERAPMCGIPFHAANTYISRLIDNNYKVAICEQLTQAQQGVMVERDVVKVITPGTIFDDDMLENKKNNFIMSIYCNQGIGVAYSDITTGEFKVYQFNNDDCMNKVNDLLTRIMPSEILVNESFKNICGELSICKSKLLPEFQTYYDWAYQFEKANTNLKNQFNTNYQKVFEIDIMPLAICSAGALIEYIKETQKRALHHINKIQKEDSSNYMILDSNTRRNLELIETIRDRRKKGSLLWLLDNTKTSAGGRMLRSWVEQPLKNSQLINLRLNAVNELNSKILVRDKLTSALSKVNDIERIVAKVSFGTVNPRDCLALKNSLNQIPQIKSCLQLMTDKKINSLQTALEDFSQITNLLELSINEDAPIVMKDGGYIKSGYNSELDEYRSAQKESRDWISKLEAEEREATGIKTLKIAYNRVFGYYIEVSNSNIANVPMRYVRKQTLTNNERYITEELKQLEDKILGSTDKAIKIESELFEQIRKVLLSNVKQLQTASSIIAEVDCLLSLSLVAIKYNYCKPLINDKIDHIKIVEGRHAVVEAVLKDENFISNDTYLNTTTDNIAIITGPNMAGKSTFMRQVALITLLAHIGSFVPAKGAEISITDRIFTRVGASDDLAFGQSTFMVEMSEVANILHNATNKSLVILDEIGRGTSTFDGLSIAWSVVEYILNKIQCKTLFATHYHELTELEGLLVGVKNYKVSIKEFNNTIIFLRKVVRGGANKSFGIEVAAMAGIPKAVTDRAKVISEELEQRDINRNIAVENTERVKSNKANLEAISLLSDLDVNKITPLGAFEIITDLVEKIKKG